MAPLLIPDLRTPGQTQAPSGLRLPQSLLQELDAHAERHHCSRNALLRALVFDGIQRLRAEVEGS